jgi:hypothetical protein
MKSIAVMLRILFCAIGIHKRKNHFVLAIIVFSSLLLNEWQIQFLTEFFIMKNQVVLYLLILAS